MDRLREVATCVKQQGFDARFGGEPPRVVYSSTAEFLRASDAEAECQRKVFSKRIESEYGGR